MSIFLKFSNCRIIIAQTTYFENIKYCKIYHHCGLILKKNSYNDSAFFFWKIFKFPISIFWIMPIFLKVSNCLTIIARITYFENLQYCKIYFHYGLVLTITSYNDSALFLEDILFSNFNFFIKCPFFLKLTNCCIITA